ncbi:hypothetical protein [Candidatus Riesia pediculischaeffi]|uniref:Aspartate/glutamate/uridylate kinase domain-containing protein n=2 Tax=Candidatus Riesia pediculischaeffi TaxID=428411 RepID=A0A1V0HK72_9ENTR|nr:hypothetical protein [Candidatus Riesia pediculischaeffi]ARC53142.1 hypothetical protein AOQ87_00250 [Candidatus Riesia pediculischaeffi]KIE64237.1 bifunctional aspartokinase I/homoserine dehydrogenase I [Candidatus Riesia pediculischaeffi PTSU]
MKVLKFGGTSLADHRNMIHVAKIIIEKFQYEPIAIVLSAPGRLTDFILEAIEAANKNGNILFHVRRIEDFFFLSFHN